jgi:hypothetical protein
MQMSTATAAAVVAAAAATNSLFFPTTLLRNAQQCGFLLATYNYHPSRRININTKIKFCPVINNMWYYINNYIKIFTFI